MRFGVLGPFEVHADAGPVSITAPKQKAILVRLLLSRGRVVPIDTLLDDVWRGRPPGGGAKTLQFHVSKLRDSLHPEREAGTEGAVVTRPSGYAIAMEPDDLDASRFERIAEEARSSAASDPERAGVLFREALSLWRGPALADFRDEPFAAYEIHRLDEQRLAVLEDRIQTDLALGRHGDVVAELEELTGEHPFRERLWSQLMVALYRCDRQADALSTYQRLRRHLGEELGIEPSVTIQALEEQILLQHEALKEPGVMQPPGGRLRGYELHQPLGQGAFGVVWRAAQPSVGRDVAIKVIRPEYANRVDFVRTFESEARLVASLEHPAIVPVFDFWRDPDGAYLVMRLMDRGSLDGAGDGAWEPVRVLRVTEQVAAAIAFAHRNGVIHGDLHPGNVLLDGEDNAYVVDFGLAARLNRDSATPPRGYASPERRHGGPATVQSDVFGLGALAFRLLTGSDPPAGTIPAVGDVRPGVPPEIEEIVGRATAPQAAARFADVDEFLESVRSALGRRRQRAPTPATNPYKGLQAFTETDAPDFFGRDTMIADLTAAVSSRRLVGVVGPSGSGKSSLVRAGLLPAVRRGRIPGSERWLITALYPGEHPFARLADALLEVTLDKPEDFARRLRAPDAAVDAVASCVPDATEMLIFVDQFEELFTLCPDQRVQVGFMDLLRSLATDPRLRVRIVLAMRADYYGHPLQHPAFGAVLGRGLVSMSPPGAEELAQAIVRPADRVGVEVEPDLVAQIVDDFSEHTGGLPLLEYALTQLFEQRDGGPLTVAAYRRSKGIGGALGSWAERLFTKLDDDGKDALRQVCLRLVAIDDDGREVRRRVRTPELRQLGIDSRAVDRSLAAYGNARLLTFDRDPDTRTPTVEIAHEALFREWERLGRWIDSRREDLVLQRRFRSAHADWEQNERDPGYLLHGGRLQQFETWSRETDLAITGPEREFLDLGREQESRTTAQRRRRRNLIGAGLVGLALAAAGFGVAAMEQGARATEQRLVAEQEAVEAGRQAEIAAEAQARAQEQERIARARALAASAVAALETDPERSVLLATEAIRITVEADGTHLREAEEALHRAVSASRLVAAIPAEMYTRSLAFGPEGDILYIGGFHTGQIAEAPSGRLIEQMPFPAAGIAIAGRDAEWLVVSDFEGGIRVRDRATLDDVFVLDGHTDWVGDLAVSGDGTLLASISHLDGVTAVWDLETGEQIASVVCEASRCPGSVTIGPHGTRVFSGGEAWEIPTGAPIADWWRAPPGSPTGVELVDESRAVAFMGLKLLVLDLPSGEVVQELQAHAAEVTDVDVGHDGRLIATAGRDGLVHLWELGPGGVRKTLTLAGHTGTVWDVEFSPDGRHLASIGGSQDFSADFRTGWPRTWEARIWDVSVAGGREWMTVAAEPGPVAFDASGDRILAGYGHGAAVWDAETGARLLVLPGPSAEARPRVMAFSPSGEMAVTGGTIPTDGSGEGWVTLWDVTTGAVVRELVPPAPGLSPTGAEFDSDGDLLVVAAEDVVRVWDTSTWEVVFTESRPDEDGSFAAAGISPDGSILATQLFVPDEAEREPVSIWSVETGRRLSGILHVPRNDRGGAAFDPHGRVVLTTGLGRPLVSEAYTGRTLVTLRAPAGYAADGAFSPDGTLIATAEGDGTVRLWDTATGEERLVLAGHSAEVASVAFSPDGTRLASVGFDGVLRVWALDLDDLLDIASARVTRGLTDEECRTYVQHACPPEDAPVKVVPIEWEPQDLLGIDDRTWEAAADGGVWQPSSLEVGSDGILALDQESGHLLVGHEVSNDPFGVAVQADLGVMDPSTGVLEDIPEPLGRWAEAVYHPGTGRILVYFSENGGFWAFDADADRGLWTRLASPRGWAQPQGDFGTQYHGPFGDYGQVMVHDVESDLVVLFGGANWGRIEYDNHLGLDETWIYDPTGDAWSQSGADLSPPPREAHAMAYDAGSDRVILFGGSPGFAADGDLYGDTWAYDANTDTWVDMDPPGGPPAREHAVMWYDPAADLVFLFGGSRGDGLPWEVFGGEELWGYDYETNTWTLFRVDPNPGYGTWADAAFDDTAGAVMLFGGEWGEWYDGDRRPRDTLGAVWTYRHEGGPG